MDINSLLATLTGQATGTNNQIDAAAVEASGQTSDMRAASTDMSAKLLQSMELAKQSAIQQAEIDRQKAAVGEQAQAIAGLNPEDVNNKYVQGIADLTAVEAARKASLQQYRKLTETSFLDNPIGYIFNQLALPQVVQQHNNLATQQDAITADLTTRMAVMNQYKSTVTANTADASKRAALLKADSDLAAQQANSDRVKMQNIGLIAASTSNEIALQDKKLQNTATLYQAYQSKANFDALQAERARAAAEHKLRMDMLLKDKATKDAQEQALGAGLARVSAELGYPIPVTVADFNKMPADSGKKLQLWHAATMGQFGTTLGEALTVFQSANLKTLNEHNPAFVKGLSEFAKAIKSEATAVQKANPGMKDKEAEAAGAASYTQKITLSAHDPKALYPLNDSYWDTNFNPNRSQDVTMLAKITTGEFPQLANNSFVAILNTTAKTIPPGTPEFRGEDQTAALKALAALIPTIGLQKAAADLVAYKRTAAAYNQKTYNLASLNLPVQDSAYVRVPGVPLIGGAAVGDTMNQVGAENLLAKIATNTMVGILTRKASVAPATFGGLGVLGVLANKQLLDTTPEK